MSKKVKPPAEKNVISFKQKIKALKKSAKKAA